MTLTEINKKWREVNGRLDYETKRHNALIDAGLKREADRVKPVLADLRRQLDALQRESDIIGDEAIARTTTLYLLADMTLGAAYDYGEWARRANNDNISHSELESVKGTLKAMVQSIYTHGSINYNEVFAKIADELDEDFQQFKERMEEVVLKNVRLLGSAFDRDTANKQKTGSAPFKAPR